jgi:alpha,alpha-trehalase
MTTLVTTFIIPVDLNTFIFKMERDIAVFAKLIGEKATAEVFSQASKARHTAIETILWNSEMEQWLDYCFPSMETRESTNGNRSHRIVTFLLLTLYPCG